MAWRTCTESERPSAPGASAGARALSARWLDPLGGIVSLGCAVHCLAAPLLVLASPAFESEGIELGLAITAGVIASTVALRGWVRRRDAVVAALVGLGVALLALRFALVEEGSWQDVAVALTVAAAFVTAHARSFRAQRRDCC